MRIDFKTATVHFDDPIPPVVATFEEEENKSQEQPVANIKHVVIAPRTI